MTGASDDLDLLAAGDPATPPQRLADIAARRHDLHAVIVTNPGTYPELRQWIVKVNPGHAQTQAAVPLAPGVPPYAGAPYGSGPVAPPVAPRRKGLGWIFAGCGCVTLVAGIVIAAVVIGGLGASTAGGGGSDGGHPTASTVEEQLDVVRTESAEYEKLAAQLDGNPVAPLVTQPARFQRLQADVEALKASTALEKVRQAQARTLAERAGQYRSDLQRLITAAEGRRANASGTGEEHLVDSAGNGFIDIQWNADSACSTSENPGSTTAGCTTSNRDQLIVHILPPEKRLGGDEAARLTTLHELAHLYQNVDVETTSDGEVGPAMKLKNAGLFQGSGEAMSDCYALTYLGLYSLTVGDATLGYGYVCNDSERQAIREWAKTIHAPMPG
ncbi:hypothetical protein ACTJJ4_03295 [Microbacterium sp. 22195]|uniref:variant leucine-rich repeat-containing protein n=1 Tax=Microbacterium sp. 22195 TaxID=3453891 RepID=UPI003F8329CE